MEDPVVDSPAVPREKCPLGVASADDDDLRPWDDDEYDVYLDEHFASPVAPSDPLGEIHPTLEAAALRFREALFLKKTLAALRHKSGLQKEIREDRLCREAGKEIEWDDIKSHKQMKKQC